MKKSNIRFTADKDFASKDSGYKKVAKSSINASTTVIQIFVRFVCLFFSQLLGIKNLLHHC